MLLECRPLFQVRVAPHADAGLVLCRPPASVVVRSWQAVDQVSTLPQLTRGGQDRGRSASLTLQLTVELPVCVKRLICLAVLALSPAANRQELVGIQAGLAALPASCKEEGPAVAALAPAGS